MNTPRIQRMDRGSRNQSLFYSLNVEADSRATDDLLITHPSLDPGSTLNEKEKEPTGQDVMDQEMEEFRLKNEKKGCCNGLNLASFVLLIALSTHALFEGIALGLTKDLAASFNIMLALTIHKTAASMSLGISISKNFKDEDIKKGKMLLLSFALATPIGIAVGLLLQDTNEIVEIVFSSIAAGTFIYIAASEVIIEEFSIPGRKKWLQMMTFMMGATLITCLWFIGG
jgi:zinc transporter ZupT